MTDDADAYAYDDDQTFDVEAWVETADTDVDPDVLAALLDVDAIREEHGAVTDEILRRHVASVEQAHRLFGHHRDAV